MDRYLLLVLSGPTNGADDESKYNDLYDNIHLPDLKAIRGVTSAWRYRMVQSNLPEKERWPYAAAYEIETDDLAGVFAAITSEMRPFSSSYDRSKSANFVAIQI